MLIYIARRLAWTVLVIVVVLFITFLVFFKLPAGDPALRFAGKSPTEESLALIRHRLHLDQPFYVEFGYFVKNFVTGDENGWPGLGYSYSGLVPVKDQIKERAPRTLWLILGAAIIWLTVGRRHRRPLGRQATIRGRPRGHGLRALRHLCARVLARPDGPLHLLAQAPLDGRHRATRRYPTASARGSRT